MIYGMGKMEMGIRNISFLVSFISIVDWVCSGSNKTCYPLLDAELGLFTKIMVYHASLDSTSVTICMMLFIIYMRTLS